MLIQGTYVPQYMKLGEISAYRKKLRNDAKSIKPLDK